jgi:hypothetical protein
MRLAHIARATARATQPIVRRCVKFTARSS